MLACGDGVGSCLSALRQNNNETGAAAEAWKASSLVFLRLLQTAVSRTQDHASPNERARLVRSGDDDGGVIRAPRATSRPASCPFSRRFTALTRSCTGGLCVGTGRPMRFASRAAGEQFMARYYRRFSGQEKCPPPLLCVPNDYDQRLASEDEARYVANGLREDELNTGAEVLGKEPCRPARPSTEIRRKCRRSCRSRTRSGTEGGTGRMSSTAPT